MLNAFDARHFPRLIIFAKVMSVHDGHTSNTFCNELIEVIITIVYNITNRCTIVALSVVETYFRFHESGLEMHA